MDGAEASFFVLFDGADPDAVAQMKPDEARQRSTALGEGHFLWFEAMQENGMRPMDAILAAFTKFDLEFVGPPLKA